jgi:hypothetical protein
MSTFDPIMLRGKVSALCKTAGVVVNCLLASMRDQVCSHRTVPFVHFLRPDDFATHEDPQYSTFAATPIPESLSGMTLSRGPGGQ